MAERGRSQKPGSGHSPCPSNALHSGMFRILPGEGETLITMRTENKGEFITAEKCDPEGCIHGT